MFFKKTFIAVMAALAFFSSASIAGDTPASPSGTEHPVYVQPPKAPICKYPAKVALTLTWDQSVVLYNLASGNVNAAPYGVAKEAIAEADRQLRAIQVEACK